MREYGIKSRSAGKHNTFVVSVDHRWNVSTESCDGAIKLSIFKVHYMEQRASLFQYGELNDLTALYKDWKQKCDITSLWDQMCYEHGYHEYYTRNFVKFRMNQRYREYLISKGLTKAVEEWDIAHAWKRFIFRKNK